MSADTAPPVILVVGTDRFSVTARFAAERDRVAAGADTGTGVDEFEGAEVDLVARALDAALTPSMFGSERVVLLRHGISEESLPLLLRFLDEPPSEATLLLAHVRSGRATKAYKQFEARIGEVGGAVIEVEAPPERTADLAGYVSRLGSDRGLRLDRDAAIYLASHLGADAGAIAAVLDQLRAAFPEAGTLGADHVCELVSGPVVAKTWDLTDAVDAGDRAGALAMLHSLLAEMAPLAVHGAVARYVRNILAAAELEPASAKQIETELGVKSFPAKKLYEKVRSTPIGAIVAAHREVAAADVAIRGGSGLDAAVVLEVLVARLAGLLGRRSRRR